MPKGSPIYNPDVQSDIDMKNTWKLTNYPASTSILSVAQTIYVDAVNGSSGGTRGTTSAFQTLSQAISVTQAGDVIEARSDLTFSGSITISVAGVTLDFRNHKVISASQTDSRKLTISADGVEVKNAEFDGTWTNSGAASTGSVIQINNKRCTLSNVYIHDSIDVGIGFTGDISGLSLDQVTIKNALIGIDGVNSNTAIVGVDIGRCSISLCRSRGTRIARNGLETNSISAINIHDCDFESNGLTQVLEGLVVHGVVDLSISNVTVTGSGIGISLDSCTHATIDSCFVRGGRAGQDTNSGLELAWCQDVTVTNSVFDGTARDGTVSTGDNTGIASSIFSSVAIPSGPFTISNCVCIGWVNGINMSSVYGVTVNGGFYTGSNAGVNFAACGKVSITGAMLESTSVSGNGAPVSIDSGTGGNNTAYGSIGFGKNYLVTNCFFKASAGCQAEVSIIAQDATDTITGVTVSGNRKVDAISFGSPVKTSIGGGSSVTNLVILNNDPLTGWNNDVNSPLIFNGGDPTGDVGNLNSKWLTFGSYAEGGGIAYSVTDHKFYIQSVKPGSDWEDLNLQAKNITLTLNAGGAAKVGSNVIETQNNKAQASGYASLDGSGKVPAAQLPTLSSGTIASTSLPLKGDGSGNAVAVTATGSGDDVLATSPTLVTPVLGVATATSVNKWALTAPSTAATLVSGADNKTYTFPEISTQIGFRDIPNNVQSANYTTVITDSGKCILHPLSDNNVRTFTIDSHANVTWRDGTVKIFRNMAVANLSVAITTDTMTLMGSGLTGTRTVAQFGELIAVYDFSTTSWTCRGTNVT